MKSPVDGLGELIRDTEPGQEPSITSDCFRCGFGHFDPVPMHRARRMTVTY